MKSSPQTVLFDAATIFGGIIQEGKPKPGDSLPSNKRDEMKALTEQTRRTVKVRFNNFTFVLNTNRLTVMPGPGWPGGHCPRPPPPNIWQIS